MPLSRSIPSEKPQIDARSTQFPAAAEAALIHLQRALQHALRAAAPQASRAQDLCGALGLDKSLAWKAYRIAYESNPTRIAQFLPGSSGFRIITEAAARAGADAESVRELQSAITTYTELVRKHGGDRASVQIMLSGATPDDRTQTSLRRAAFRASSFVAGLQADCFSQTFFVSKAKTPGRLDVALVRAFIGLRRLRARAAFAITRPVASGDQGVPLPVFVSEPLSDYAVDSPGTPLSDSAQVAREIGLIPEFCSRPLPTFVRAACFEQRMEYELGDGPIGKPGMLDCVIGEVLRNVVSNQVTPGSMSAEHAMQIRIPVHTAMLNVFIEHGALPDIEPAVAVFSEFRGHEFRRGADRERYRLPGHERAERVGTGAQAGNCTEVPRYTELAQFVFDRLRWQGDSFTLYRLRMQHPFVPCAALMSNPLFEA
jgi:hypothetical protein